MPNTKLRDRVLNSHNNTIDKLFPIAGKIVLEKKTSLRKFLDVQKTCAVTIKPKNNPFHPKGNIHSFVFQWVALNSTFVNLNVWSNVKSRYI